ncbi:MAG: hypothetical protein KatS3mg060_1575 [Dehalococcoidia bacterium]|nr:MAG: hypothetical protein KatS3mg060_1575 [Dehalococcoidia bacterium]
MLRVAGWLLFIVGVAGQIGPAIVRQGSGLVLPSAVVLSVGCVLLVAAERRFTAGTFSAGGAAGDEPTRTLLRRVCLIGAPAVLVAIESFHPAGFTPEVYAILSQPQAGYFGPHWWMTLHLIQTPMIGLVAAGMWLLVAGQTTVWAWLARIAAVVFVVYYTVLDAVGGIYLGWLLSSPLNAPNAASRPAIETIVTTMWTDPLIGGVGSVVSQVGSWAFLVTALSAALALARQQAPLWPLAAIVLAGNLVQLSHARPYGPLGFGLLLIGAVGIELWRTRAGLAVTPLANTG